MKKSILIAALIAAGLGLNGCVHYTSAPVMKKISSQNDAKKMVRKGMTMSQVESIMGRPTSKNVMGDRAMWVYTQTSTGSYTFSKALYQGLTGTAISDYKSVAITFNGSGRVSSVRFMARTY